MREFPTLEKRDNYTAKWDRKEKYTLKRETIIQLNETEKKNLHWKERQLYSKMRQERKINTEKRDNYTATSKWERKEKFTLKRKTIIQLNEKGKKKLHWKERQLYS